ncbi:uncharacterized protein LOC116955828 isoform X2 [Petromyzon marinus]|uniref:uncharacterized protein LOC116955828 isoform X2 n=1 Tax=Petromyzon marinus TaxID=7757 RepID=UPI003F6F4936
MGSECSVRLAWSGHLRQKLLLSMLLLLLQFTLLPWALGGDSCERGALVVVGPPPSVEALEGDDVTLACLYNFTTERGGRVDVEWTYSPHHVDLHADHVLVTVYANGRVHHGASVLPSPLAGHAAFARPGALGEAAGDAALLVSGASRHHAGRYSCRVRALPCSSERRVTWLVVRAVRSHVVLVAMVTFWLGVLALVMLALWLRARRSRERRGRLGVSREEAELCAVTSTEVAPTRGWWKDLDREGESEPVRKSGFSRLDVDSCGSHNPFSSGHADSDGEWSPPHNPDDSDHDSRNPFSDSHLEDDGEWSPPHEPDDSDHDSRNPFSDSLTDDGWIGLRGSEGSLHRAADRPRLASTAAVMNGYLDAVVDCVDLRDVDEEEEVEEVLDITNPFFIPDEPEATSSFGNIAEVTLTPSSGHEPWNPFEDGDTDDNGDGSEDTRS